MSELLEEQQPAGTGLSDGRTFTIVKRYWAPDELVGRAHGLGFELDPRLTTNGLFLYGAGSIVGGADDARPETRDAAGVPRSGA